MYNIAKANIWKQLNFVNPAGLFCYSNVNYTTLPVAINVISMFMTMTMTMIIFYLTIMYKLKLQSSLV